MTTQPKLDRLCVVLVGTRNPLNIGAAARAMSNFGFSQLRLVKPYGPSYREARSAVGAAELLQHAREYATLADAVADCELVVGTTAARDRELHHALHRLEQGARLIRTHLTTARAALLFGSEKRGLANADLSHCHWLMRIPTGEEHGSMNLGQAVAICLYELARDARAKPQAARAPMAASAEQERITQYLLQALTAAGYVKSGAATSTEEKLRRMVRRMKLHSEDAEILQGMLRKVLWKLDH